MNLLKWSPETGRRLRDLTLLKRMLKYVRPYFRHLALAVLMVFVMVLCANSLPVLVKHAIDDYLVSDASLATADRMAGLWRVAYLYIGIGVVAFALRFGHAFLLTWVGQKVIFDIRADIFSKILRLPLSFADRTPVGRLMTRVTSDVAAMQRALTDGVVALVADVFALLGIMVFMFVLSPRLALVIFTMLPVLLVVITFINVRIRNAHRRVRHEQAGLNTYLQEMISGMLTVQIFNQEADAMERFDERNDELKGAMAQSVFWFSYFFPAVEILGAATVVLLLTVGGLFMLHGAPDVSAGVLVAFLMYIREFFRPIEDLSEKSNNLQSALASGERIFALMDTPETVADPIEPREITSFRGDVEMDRVWFAYNDEDWVLENLSLHIAPGESVAIVGATGAGKTSIASLLARLYDVQRGAVRVDGIDVRDLRQADLRRRIGIVLQDPFVFSGSVADNIGLHHPDLSREKIVQAARYVNADAFINKLPNGYDTELHERGSELSTGQKQLLALARALAQNPDILLILDEATANVDTETEQLIQDALQKLMHGRTSILIAHRLSTIQHVDRILVMRHGKLVEQGSHQELVDLGGYYKRLYDLLFYSATD